jgi:hypothetical protein
MTISRRELLFSGSALSVVWLAGCGGGGPASGAPKPGVTTSSTCTAATVTNAGSGEVTFSNVTTFPHADIPLMLVPAVGERLMGCTNQIVTGVENPYQELTLCFVQTLTDAQTCNGNIVRALRLHLSIHHDTSSATLDSGYTFTWAADSSGPAAGEQLFSGELIVTDPQSDDGNNSAVYRITGGTLVLDSFSSAGLASLQLTNVTATAAAAGSGNNAVYAGAGQVHMDGTLNLLFDAIPALIPVAV